MKKVDQADHLRTLSFVNAGAKCTRIISVTSGKGGVGKTNVAVNLAILMSRRGLKVLLVDADIGLANTHILLGCRVERSLDDVMFKNVAFKDIFIQTNFGFDLLPGSSGLRKLIELDPFEQRALFDRLYEAMHGYDIVIYDTSPGLSTHVLDFNSSAHDIVVVSHPEPTALADAYALVKVLATERREKRFKLLINRSRSAQDGLDAFRRLTMVSDEFLNVGVDYLGALPEDLSLLRAVKTQTPVAVDSPRAPFTMALERVGDKLLASSISATKPRILSRAPEVRAVGDGIL